MKKRLVIVLVLFAALAVLVTACSAPPTPTPTPKPTVPPTPLPPPTLAPTITPTKAPTLAPTATQTSAPTMTPTPSTPSPTPLPPTRTPVPATPKPAATATPAAPPAPKGSIAYHKNDNGIDRIFVLNLSTNTTTALVDVGPVMDIALNTNARIGEFSPDNTRFAYVFAGSINGSNALKILDFRIADATSNTRGIYSAPTGAGAGLSSPTWSPDGNRIAFIRTDNNQQFWAVAVINADASGGPTDILPNLGGEQFRGGIAWSKQGVLTLARNVAGPNDVYSLFTDGGGLTNLTNSPADDSTPAWSPDGKMIAFTSNRDGRQQIYVMNANGTGTRRVSQSSVNDFSPTWSPDGNWIAFTSSRGDSTDIYMMDVRGGNVKRLTTGGGDRPSWSH